MDEENSERSTSPIFMTFDEEEPLTRVVDVTPGLPYLETLSSSLTVLQMAFSLGFVICLNSVPQSNPRTFVVCFDIIALGGFCLSFMLLLSRLVNLHQRFPDFAWLKTEFVSCWVLELCHFVMVVRTVFTSIIDHIPLYMVGAFFSLGAMVVYGMNAWYKYRDYRMEKHRRQRRNRTISSIGVTYQPTCYPRY